MIPLYGFLQGDTIGLLILADESDTAAILAEKLQAAARVRVKPKSNVKVIHDGHSLDLQITVAQAHIEALDRIDVVEAEPR